MHPSRKAQIAYLKADKALIKVPSKYTDFGNVFLQKLVVELPEHIKINNHAIQLMDNWQPSYNLIYSLGPLELEMLKTYIENNLVSDFIKLSKSLARAPIFFDKKVDGNLRLFVDYWGLNNLTIKNRHFLLLICELLDRLG